MKNKIKTQLDINLNKFIQKCKEDLKCISDDGDWDLNSWYCSGLVGRSRGIKFMKAKVKNGRLVVSDELFSSEYLNLAKALVVYNIQFKGRKIDTLKPFMPTLRFLEKALIETTHSANIININNKTIDWLVNTITEHYSTSAAIHSSREMKYIFEILHGNNLIPKSISWPNYRFSEKVEPIGKQGAQLHREKMADEEDLINMATIFSKILDSDSPGINGINREGNGDCDLFITSVFAFLMAGPRRLGEVLNLPIDCLGEGVSSDGKKCLVIKFFCEKGTGHVDQPVPSNMVPIIKEAVARAKKSSEYGRWLASWLEQKPSEFPRHKTCPDVDEDTPLDDRQIRAALGHLPLRKTLLKFKDNTILHANIEDIFKATGFKRNIIKKILNSQDARDKLCPKTIDLVIEKVKEHALGPYSNKALTIDQFTELYHYPVHKVAKALTGHGKLVAQETREKIVTLAKDLKVGPYHEKPATEKDLIDKSGYSKLMVRRVFRYHNSETQKIRETVIDHAQRLKVGPYKIIQHSIRSLAEETNIATHILQDIFKNPDKYYPNKVAFVHKKAKKLNAGPYKLPTNSTSDLIELLNIPHATVYRILQGDDEFDEAYSTIIRIAKEIKYGPFYIKNDNCLKTISDMLKCSPVTVRLALSPPQINVKLDKIEQEIRRNAQEMKVGPFAPPKKTYEEIAESINVPLTQFKYIIDHKDVYDLNIQKIVKNTAKKLNYNPHSGPPITLRTLNNYIHSKLPTHFPKIDKNLPTQYKDALFCRLRNQGSNQINTSLVLLQGPSSSLSWDTHVNGLGRNKKVETIWHRFNIKRNDGKKPYMNTHSIRHFLDTLGAEAGLNQMERAWWAGRKQAKQNEVYDHRSDEYFLEQEKKLELNKTYNMQGDNVLDKISRQLPVTPEEVNLAAATAISTPMGFCARSIQQLPCQIVNDCITCTKLFCIKGDDVKKEQYLDEQLRLTEQRLNNAFEAEDDGLSGASRYVIYQQEKLENLRKMKILQTSPIVPNGSLLQLKIEDTSPMSITLQKHTQNLALENKKSSSLPKKKLMKKRR